MPDPVNGRQHFASVSNQNHRSTEWNAPGSSQPGMVGPNSK